MSGFLLDTNVISELIKPRPNPGVTTWITSVEEDQLHLSVLTLGEIRKGINSLATNTRRVSLETWLQHDLVVRFVGRILDIDQDVADRWGQISAEVSAKKRILPVIDGLIAATAMERGLTVVTRNSGDMELTRVPVLNPWT